MALVVKVDGGEQNGVPLNKQLRAMFTYHNEQHKINPIPKAVRILYIIHDVRPALQRYDQKDGHPRHANVVERNGALERIAAQLRAVRVILIPINARRIRWKVVGERFGRGCACVCA